MATQSEAGPGEIRDKRKDEGTQEGITVAIRMRPLNKAEGNKQRIWKVLPKYNSITQTTNTGKPLSERITGRTFFTFDKTFGEDINTNQVYESVAKGIVSSVVNGLNGTIFAYGQTSSGKTYTMQGSGSIEQGSSGEGGIVHMAAKDIFAHIESQQNRVFVVQASFLEIYNEEVRDLLSNTNQTLPIREDPRRGVFVQAVEEIVTDFESLLRILFHGEKSRAIASTGMNERSSRSHTIFRVTIESREKEPAETDENRPPSSDGAVRVSTLNLVDLAGSESVRHTGATGERQKEGGMINQSLLTLSRVIVSLGNANQGHINFRDSKLTRILQPSLSGNARMAVVCCATPSELYLEETRSTLQFASRAKLVKTNAQVNEVLDDRSIIKRLQRELAEARRQTSVSGDTEHLRNLENRAETAGTVAKEAKEKLDRLKASILNTGYLFANSTQSDGIAINGVTQNVDIARSRKRRQSDGGTFVRSNLPISPASRKEPVTPKTSIKQRKKPKFSMKSLSPRLELGILREALASRSESLRSLKRVITECGDLMRNKDAVLENITSENKELKEQSSETQKELGIQKEQAASLQATFEEAIAAHEAALSEKEDLVLDSVQKLEHEMDENRQLKTAYLAIENELTEFRKQAQAEKQEVEVLNEELRRQVQELQESFDSLSDERNRSASEAAQLTTENAALAVYREEDKKKLEGLAERLEAITSSMDKSENERIEALAKYSETQLCLQNTSQESNEMKERNSVLEEELVALKQALAQSQETEKERNSKIEQSQSDIQALEEQLTAQKSRSDGMVCENESLQQQLEQMQNSLEEVSKYAELLENSSKDKEVALREKLESEKKVLEEQCTAEQLKSQELIQGNDELNQQTKDLKASLQEMSADLESAAKAIAAHQETNQRLQAEYDSAKNVCMTQENSVMSLQKQLEDMTEARENSESEKKVLEESLSKEQTKCNELLLNNDTLTKQAEQLERALSALSVDFQSATKSVTGQQEMNHKLKEDYEIMKQLCSRQEEIALSSQSQIESLTAAKETSETKKDAIEAELQKTLEALSQAQESNDNLASQFKIFESQTSDAKNKLKEIEEEAELLWKEKETNETVIAELRTGVQTLEAATTELQSQNETIEKDRADLELANAELKDQVLELQRDAKSQKEKEDSLLTNENNQKESIQILEAEVEAVKSQLLVSTDRLGTLAAENDSLRIENGDMENRLSVVETEKVELEKALSELGCKDAQKETQISDLQLRSSELEAELRDRHDEIETLISENADMRSAFEAERNSMSNQIDSSHHELSTLRQEMISTAEANSSLQETLMDLEAKLKQSQTKEHQALADKQSLITEFAKLETDLKGRLEEISRMNEHLHSENQGLLDTQAKLAAVRDEISTQLNELGAQHSTLQSEYEILAAKMAAFEEARKAQIEVQQVETATLTEANDSLLETASDMKRRIDSLEQELAEVHEKMTRLSSERDSAIQANSAAFQQLQIALESAENRVAELAEQGKASETNLSAAQQITTELESRLVDSDNMREALTAENEDLRSRLSSLDTELQELENQLERAQGELDVLQQEKSSLEVLLSESQEKTRLLCVQIAETEEQSTLNSSEKEKLASRLELLHQEASTRQAQLTEEKKELETNLSMAQQHARELESQLVDSHTTEQRLIAENEDVQSRLSSVAMQQNELENQLESLLSELKVLEGEKTSLEEIVSESKENCRVLDAQLSEVQQQSAEEAREKEGIVSRLELLQQQLSEREARFTAVQEELESKLCELEEVRNDLEVEKVELATVNDNLRLENQEIRNELESQRIEKIEMESHIMTLKSDSMGARARRDSMEASRGEWEQEISSKDEELTTAKEQIELLTSQKDNLLNQLQEHKDALSQEKSDLEARISELETHTSSLEIQGEEISEVVKNLKEENSRVAQQLEAVRLSKVDLERQLSLIQKETIATNEQADELQSTIKSLEEKLEREQDEKERRVADLQRCNADIQAKKEELQRDIESRQLENDDLKDRLTAFEQEIEKLEAEEEQTIALKSSMQALEERFQATEGRLEEVQINLRHESSLRETLQKSLQERELERDEATSALQNEYEKNRALSRKVSESLTKEKEADLVAEISELKMSNAELQQLLASSNESEQRFRKTASQTEKELSQKEAELEDASYRLSQMEEELRLSEMSSVDNDQVEESQKNLLTRIDDLISEKVSLEKDLEKERRERLTSENNLKKQMGEEQRLLIQEGENVMSKLRTKVEVLEGRLQESEAEAYAARQHIEELGDEKKSLQKANMEANRASSGLKTEIERQESQISSLQSELSKIRADCYALKESSIEMKDKMRKALRECEKANREKDMTSSEVSTLKKKISALENECTERSKENRQLATKLQKTEARAKTSGEDQAMHSKEAQLKEEEIRKLVDVISNMKQEKKSLVSEVKRLGEIAVAKESSSATSKNASDVENILSEVEKLRRELADKDRRIKKLKAVSLTKEQAEHIRNIKESNARLSQENGALQSQLEAMGSDSAIRTEISELRFDKQALEKKLRKFAAHCQRLEDDKAGIIDTLRTSQRGIDSDCDINEAIISLCDKVASLEEAQATRSVGSNSSTESVDRDNKDLKSEIRRLRRREEELMDKASAFQRQVEQLNKKMKDVNEDVDGVHSEMSRKLRYLEQENLQLMLDLKQTRKQLQGSREEAEMLRLNVVETPTLDFGAVELEGSSTSSGSIELTETIKSEKEASEPVRRSKRLRGNITDTPTKGLTETVQPRKRHQASKPTLLGDSTNLADKENSTPGYKRDRGLMPRSSKKKHRQPAPGLGEAAVDGNDTGECTQS